MLLWFAKMLVKIKRHLSHERCYDYMETAGIAVMGCCCGIVGDVVVTDYISALCLDCPHFVPVKGR